jgi:hypothetical protein
MFFGIFPGNISLGNGFLRTFPVILPGGKFREPFLNILPGPTGFLFQNLRFQGFFLVKKRLPGDFPGELGGFGKIRAFLDGGGTRGRGFRRGRTVFHRRGSGPAGKKEPKKGE